MGKGVMAGRGGSWDAGSVDIEGEDRAEAGMGGSGCDGRRFLTCVTADIGSNPPRSRQRALMTGTGKSWDTGAGPIDSEGGARAGGYGRETSGTGPFRGNSKGTSSGGSHSSRSPTSGSGIGGTAGAAGGIDGAGASVIAGAGGCGEVSDNAAAEDSTSGGVVGATGIGGSTMAENLGKGRDTDSEAAREGIGSTATSSGGDRGA